MAMEIERKFLVKGSPWQENHSEGIRITQGYLCTDRERTIRIRLCQPMPCSPAAHKQAAQDQQAYGQETAYITIKSFQSPLSNREYQYAIPPQEARVLLDTLAIPPLVEKIRYCIAHEGHMWEVDVFLGLNAGLVVAEIELSHEDEAFTKPAWLLEEVTYNTQYKNSQLVQKPFSTW